MSTTTKGNAAVDAAVSIALARVAEVIKDVAAEYEKAVERGDLNDARVTPTSFREALLMIAERIDPHA